MKEQEIGKKGNKCAKEKEGKNPHHLFLKKIHLKQSFVFKGELQKYMIMRKQVLKGETEREPRWQHR